MDAPITNSLEERIASDLSVLEDLDAEPKQDIVEKTLSFLIDPQNYEFQAKLLETIQEFPRWL